MRHLNDTINEAMLDKPMTEDGKVKVIALVANDRADDNLSLMKGMNKVCLIWTPEDGKGYMCANGGKSWNDGLQWNTLSSLIRVIGKQDWKEIDKLSLSYSYWSTTGSPKEHEMTAYFAEISQKDMDKLYKQNGKSLWIIKHRGYSTAAVRQVMLAWKDDGYLGN